MSPPGFARARKSRPLTLNPLYRALAISRHVVVCFFHLIFRLSSTLLGLFFFFFYLLPCVSLLVFVARRSVSASPTRQAVRPISRATALRNGAVACWCSPTTSDQIRHFRLPLLDTLQRPPPTEEKQKPVGLDTYIPLVRIDASCAAPPHTLFVLSSTSKHPLHPCVAPSTHPAPPHRAFSPSLLFFGASRVEPSA